MDLLTPLTLLSNSSSVSLPWTQTCSLTALEFLRLTLTVGDEHNYVSDVISTGLRWNLALGDLYVFSLGLSLVKE